MIGKNIKHYRLLKKMSQAALAESVGIKKMAVSNYEAGKRIPNYEISRKLAKVLGVSLSMLFAQSGENLVIKHGAFRKQSSLTKSQKEIVLGKTDRYLARLYEAISFVGLSALSEVPIYKQMPADDFEQAGQYLRQILKLAPNGPVGNITDILENRGFIICPIDFEGRGFSGNSGIVNDRPYIVINVAMSAERQRFTLIHELAHLVFIFRNGQNEERMVDGIAGAFLIPQSDMVRELGPKRSDIRGNLKNIRREYGTSMVAIVMRAQQIGIINKMVYENTMKWLSANGLRSDEKSGLIHEKTHLLEQLVYRAVAEDEISISKAAEILEMPLLDARMLCYGGA